MTHQTCSLCDKDMRPGQKLGWAGIEKRAHVACIEMAISGAPVSDPLKDALARLLTATAAERDAALKRLWKARDDVTILSRQLAEAESAAEAASRDYDRTDSRLLELWADARSDIEAKIASAV